MKNKKVKLILTVLLTAVMVTACSQKEKNSETADAVNEKDQVLENEEKETETVTPELDEDEIQELQQQGETEERKDGESSSSGAGSDSESSVNTSKNGSTASTQSGSSGPSDTSADSDGSGSNSDSSAQNAAADSAQNSDSSSAAANSDTEEGVKAKVKMYEGEYFDEILYSYVDSEVEFSPYCEFHISNVTDTSFDFEIYEVGEKEKKTLIFKKHTAVFTGDGMQAVYNGNEYTLSFTFPDERNAYPDVVDLRVSGFAPVEGRTYVNNMVPGHEFG